MTIYVIGYYGHHNFGDDQYKESFKKLLNRNDLKFIDCDLIENHEFMDDDFIILGGGDVLVNYFVDKIHQKFDGKPNQIIAVSVGIPYIDILLYDYKKLEIFSRIYVRTKQDLDILREYFPAENIYYLPDISKIITDDKIMTIRDIDIQKNQRHVGICLSRHIHNPVYIEIYYNFIKSMSLFITYLVELGYRITLLPFNTNNNNMSENDILIQNDVMQLLSLSTAEYVTNITVKQSVAEMNTHFKSFSFVIPMRFHACLFSIHNNIPFIPIITTRKITNLLKDINWSMYYRFEHNIHGIPNDITFEKIKTILRDIDFHYVYKVQKLQKINTEMTKHVSNINIDDILNKRTVNISRIAIKFKLKSAAIISKINEYVYPELYPNISTDKHVACVQLVSFYLSGKINSVYNHGLLEKMFNPNFNYVNEWKWIADDIVKRQIDNTTPIHNVNGKYNISYIDQHDKLNVHRSGWQYVTQAISQYQTPSSDVVLLDLYTDRTFHWETKINKLVGIIPYKHKWVGVIHHTFDESFSEYNSHTLFKSHEFLASLNHCNGLIVLSKYLQEQVKQKLIDINMHDIPVHYICHPTEVNVPKFEMKLLRENTKRQIIHVGGWLRNIYSFYNIIIPKNLVKKSWFGLVKTNYPIKKSVLHGLCMDNYFPQKNMIHKLTNVLGSNNYNTTESPIISTNSGSGGVIVNNWYKHMCEDLTTKMNSIDHLPHVSNKVFDKLLSSNVVFINVVDPSAVNTLIECTVRNTPIIINKHPAVVEILGPNYPLYYENTEDMNIKIYELITYDNIKKAHKYMKCLDKRRFNIETFITNFNKLFK